MGCGGIEQGQRGLDFFMLSFSFNNVIVDLEDHFYQ
jgi:hypothetical protein